MTRPPRLRIGDRVAVVAPSGPVEPAALERGCRLLASWGLDVQVGRHARQRAGYLAGSDAERAADFTAAWLDPAVRAVFCARGGYGALRMVDLVDWGAPNPRLLVGSSDVTTLHEAVRSQLGWVTLFGPMVAGMLGDPVADPAGAAYLRDTLFRPTARQYAGLRHVAGPARSVSGRLTGGTLSLLAAGIGGRHARPPDGDIVFLEDVAEAPYRLDRLLTQLHRAGWLSGAAAVVLGTFVRCENGGTPVAGEVLAERLGGLGVPVLAGLPVGHGPRQLTLPLGIDARLDPTAGTLALRQPPLGGP